MANEELDLTEDILSQIGITSVRLADAEAGSKERKTESEIYDQNIKAVIAIDEFNLKREVEFEKIDLEKSKVEKNYELEKLKLENDRLRIENDCRKAKNEKWSLWAKIGLAGATIATDVGLGILYLKSNLKYGGMVGKDGKGWFDQIRKIRL